MDNNSEKKNLLGRVEQCSGSMLSAAEITELFDSFEFVKTEEQKKEDSFGAADHFNCN